MSESFTWVEPAAKGQSAVLLVKGKGINLQVTCWDHLDGFVVFYCSRAVDINIWDDWGFANMDAGEREEDTWCNESITRQNSFPGNKRSLWCGQERCIYHVRTIHLWWHQAPRWHPRTAIFQWFHQTLQDPKRETHRSISETLEQCGLLLPPSRSHEKDSDLGKNRIIVCVSLSQKGQMKCILWNFVVKI